MEPGTMEQFFTVKCAKAKIPNSQFGTLRPQPVIARIFADGIASWMTFGDVSEKHLCWSQCSNEKMRVSNEHFFESRAPPSPRSFVVYWDLSKVPGELT
jgi:hypothetical protein